MESALGKIVVVEDEPHICEVIRLYLEHAGYEAAIYHRGDVPIEQLMADKPDLFILDLMLPERSGYEICSEIRALPTQYRLTPIILLTAKGEATDKLKGFNLGVDDYIVKPFDPNELIARIKAVLRRSKAGVSQTIGTAVERKEETVLEIGSMKIYPDQYKVLVDGQRIDLFPKEIELICHLAAHPGKVFSREDLLDKVWKFDFAGGTRTVDTHIKNIRKKLGSSPQWSIETLWGIGYCFEVTSHDR